MIEEKLKYFKATSMILDKKKKSPNGINMTSAFGLFMFANWSKLAKPLIKKAGNQPTTNTDWVDGFISEIDETMGKFQGNIEEEQAEYVNYLYRYFKNNFIKKNKIEILKKADIPEILPILWLEMDEEAVKGIMRIVSESSGKFYTNSVKLVVAESVKKNIFERNLPLNEAVEAMQLDLMKALKLEPGSLVSEVVPTGYRGTAESYFAGLADYTATLSRTTGDIMTLNEIEAKSMVVRSVRSSRTCVGCLQMDGTVIPVTEAMQHTNKKLAVDTIEDLKNVQPFFHFKSPSEYSEEGLKVAQASAKELTADATLLPPFHFRCECFIDMV